MPQLALSKWAGASSELGFYNQRFLAPFPGGWARGENQLECFGSYVDTDRTKGISSHEVGPHNCISWEQVRESGEWEPSCNVTKLEVKSSQLLLIRASSTKTDCELSAVLEVRQLDLMPLIPLKSHLHFLWRIPCKGHGASGEVC